MWKALILLILSLNPECSTKVNKSPYSEMLPGTWFIHYLVSRNPMECRKHCFLHTALQKLVNTNIGQCSKFLKSKNDSSAPKDRFCERKLKAQGKSGWNVSEGTDHMQTECRKMSFLCWNLFVALPWFSAITARGGILWTGNSTVWGGWTVTKSEIKKEAFKRVQRGVSILYEAYWFI